MPRTSPQPQRYWHYKLYLEPHKATVYSIQYSINISYHVCVHVLLMCVDVLLPTAQCQVLQYSYSHSSASTVWYLPTMAGLRKDDQNNAIAATTTIVTAFKTCTV